MIYSGAPGVAGNRTLGTPAGGGSLYDVPGPLAPSYSEGGQDPEHPVPAVKVTEPSGGSSWSDTFRTLAVGAGELIIKKFLGSEGSTGNRTTETKSKGELGSSAEIIKPSSSTPRPPSTPTTNSGIGGLSVGLLAAGALVVVLLIMFSTRR